MATETMTVTQESYSVVADYAADYGIYLTVPKLSHDLLDVNDGVTVLATKGDVNTALEVALQSFLDAVLLVLPNVNVDSSFDLVQLGQKKTAL